MLNIDKRVTKKWRPDKTFFKSNKSYYFGQFMHLTKKDRKQTKSLPTLFWSIYAFNKER